jgi:hypothetical protein
LTDHTALDKTVLYNNLLKQFVERERAKDPNFGQLDTSKNH